MSARECLLNELRTHALVIGDVTLTSGATARYYVDVKRAILKLAGFSALAELVAERVRGWGATAVGGTTMGADPIACAALAGGADVAAFFVRKETKPHGLQRRIEGPLLEPSDRRSRGSATATAGLLLWGESEAVDVAAVPQLMPEPDGSLVSARAWSPASIHTRIAPRPSKPSGCRSKGCRRRTWRRSAAAPRKPEAPRAGFEPAAYSLGGSRSIRLSYRGRASAVEPRALPGGYGARSANSPPAHPAV